MRSTTSAMISSKHRLTASSPSSSNLRWRNLHPCWSLASTPTCPTHSCTDPNRASMSAISCAESPPRPFMDPDLFMPPPSRAAASLALEKDPARFPLSPPLCPPLLPPLLKELLRFPRFLSRPPPPIPPAAPRFPAPPKPPTSPPFMAPPRPMAPASRPRLARLTLPPCARSAASAAWLRLPPCACACRRRICWSCCCCA